MLLVPAWDGSPDDGALRLLVDALLEVLAPLGPRDDVRAHMSALRATLEASLAAAPQHVRSAKTSLCAAVAAVPPPFTHKHTHLAYCLPENPSKFSMGSPAALHPAMCISDILSVFVSDELCFVWLSACSPTKAAQRCNCQYSVRILSA